MRRMTLARVVRIAITVVFLIVLTAIAGYFLTRSRSRLQVASDAEKIDDQKIEKREKVEHVETEGTKEKFNLRADRFYASEDGQNHLEGHVEIVFPKKREGKDVILRGDEVVFDKDKTYFHISGQARVEYKDLVVESTLLHYSDKEEIFWTRSGGNFSSQRLNGSALKMDYALKEEKIRLSEKVELWLKPRLSTSLPFIVKGNELTYSRANKRGSMESGVSLFHGESQASADALEFELTADEDDIRTLDLSGNVKANLVKEQGEEMSSENQPSFYTQSIRREVEADTIKLRAFPNVSAAEEIEAQGRCSFKFILSSGGFTHILADTIKLVFDEKERLKEFHALRNARMIDQGEGAEEQRTITGEILTIKDQMDVLHVKGKGPFEAVIQSAESDIFAEEFTAFLNTNDFEARKGVKAVLKPKKGEERRISIFSKEQPVFFRGREMRYFDEQKRFLFQGDIKAWQEKKMVFADEIDLDRETGKTLCTGSVKSVLPYEAEEGKEEKRVEISSRRMAYKPEDNVIVYEEGSSLKTKDFDLSAQSVFVHLKPEGEDIDRIVAKGKILLHQNSMKGKGEEAIYSPKDESIALLGNPFLADKEMGITRGDKLTFYIADGRILVENRGKERSVAVIKRER